MPYRAIRDLQGHRNIGIVLYLELQFFLIGEFQRIGPLGFIEIRVIKVLRYGDT